MRKTLRRIAYAIGIPAAAAGLIFATTTPALATDVHIYEAFGTQAVGATTLCASCGVETTVAGRTIDMQWQYTNGAGRGVYKLQIVASGGDGYIRARDSDFTLVQGGAGADGTLWTRFDGNCAGCWQWRNNRQSDRTGSNLWMTGLNYNAKMFVAGPGTPGYYQTWLVQAN